MGSVMPSVSAVPFRAVARRLSSITGCSRVRFWLVLGIVAAAIFPASAHATQGPVGEPALSSVQTAHPLIALTFDDGPSPQTPQILAILHTFHAHATFFLVGMHVRQYPSIVKAEVDARDTLGNHTYTHADLLWLPDPEAEWQLSATQAAVHAAAGITPHWFRPPYEAVDLHVEELAAGLGLRTALWSVDPRDWARPGVGAIVWTVLTYAHRGSVVLLHDGGGDRSETIAALPIILRTLKARGYRLVTLDRLTRLDSTLSPPRSASRRSGAGR